MTPVVDNSNQFANRPPIPNSNDKVNNSRATLFALSGVKPASYGNKDPEPALQQIQPSSAVAQPASLNQMNRKQQNLFKNNLTNIEEKMEDNVSEFLN